MFARTSNLLPTGTTLHATWAPFCPSTARGPLLSNVTCCVVAVLVSKGELVQCDPAPQLPGPVGLAKWKEAAPCAAGGTASLQAATKAKSPDAPKQVILRAVIIRDPFAAM